MRGTAAGILGGLTVAIFCLSVTADHRDVHAQHRRPIQAAQMTGESLIALDGGLVDGQQLVVLIDQQRHAMGSYLVNRQNGQITLRCVRNFRWDLQMDEFNGGEPSPEKIQALLQAR